MPRPPKPATTCDECRHGIPEYLAGCMKCGQANPRFSPAAYEQEFGHPHAEALARCRSAKGHADAQKVLQDFPGLPFCEICRANLWKARVKDVRVKKTVPS